MQGSANIPRVDRVEEANPDSEIVLEKVLDTVAIVLDTVPPEFLMVKGFMIREGITEVALGLLATQDNTQYWPSLAIGGTELTAATARMVTDRFKSIFHDPEMTFGTLIFAIPQGGALRAIPTPIVYGNLDALDFQVSRIDMPELCVFSCVGPVCELVHDVVEVATDSLSAMD